MHAVLLNCSMLVRRCFIERGFTLVGFMSARSAEEESVEMLVRENKKFARVSRSDEKTVLFPGFV